MAWPTSKDPRTEFATLRMTATEAAAVDATAHSRGQSRSEFFRDAAANEIERDQKAQRRAANKARREGQD